MAYYPLFVDLSDRRCVVVGGGKVAERKVLSLLQAGAQVTVISPSLIEELKLLYEQGKILYVGSRFQAGQLDRAFLVISATSDAEVNQAVSEEAQKKGILVNVVDQPQLCSFIVPSLVNRGALKIAISTSGKSPALAKKLRQDLEEKFGPEYPEFLDLLEEARHKVILKYADEEKRKEILTKLVNMPGVVELLRDDLTEEARKKLEECI